MQTGGDRLHLQQFQGLAVPHLGSPPWRQVLCTRKGPPCPSPSPQRVPRHGHDRWKASGRTHATVLRFFCLTQKGTDTGESRSRGFVELNRSSFYSISGGRVVPLPLPPGASIQLRKRKESWQVAWGRRSGRPQGQFPYQASGLCE